MYSRSIVEYLPDVKSGGQCGYCRGRKGSYQNGMWGHVLTCQDYQDLIDRGWRRSGRYCYKPTMDKTCCPQYTIKCDATQFKLTKSQKKVLKNFRNFIIQGSDPPKTNLPQLDSCEDDSDSDDEGVGSDEKDMEVGMDDNQAKAIDLEKKLKLDPSKVQLETKNKSETVESESMSEPQGPSQAGVKAGLGADPSKPKAKKKKELRKERALAKLKAAGKTEADFYAKKALKNGEKTLEDLTDTSNFPADSAHKLEIRLVNAQTSDANFKRTYLDSFAVYRKYQAVIHKESPSKCTLDQFKRFLCNSSLVPTPINGDENSQNYGAFHQQYIIDGRIVAVGVIDILPHCVSSVYLYYDPDFAFLSPGTLTSLYEIAWTRQLQAKFPALKYYYMGFYIHSCPKMRYKAKYYPSWLLCPKSYEWVSIKQSLPLLDKSKYAILSSKDEESKNEANDSIVLFNNQAMGFRVYRGLHQVDEDELQQVQEYADLVGSKLSKKILLYRE